MSDERDIADRISLVERKLELRRERLHRHLGEVKTSVQPARRWAPVALIGAIALLGFALARRGASRRHAPAAYGYPPASFAGRQARTAGIAGAAGALATLGTAVLTGVRLASSREGQMVWNALRARMQRR